MFICVLTSTYQNNKQSSQLRNSRGKLHLGILAKNICMERFREDCTGKSEEQCWRKWDGMNSSLCLPSCHKIIHSYSCQANTYSFTLLKEQRKSEIRIYFGTQKYKTELLPYNIRWGKKTHIISKYSNLNANIRLVCFLPETPSPRV